jgi:hypothetical protein
MSHEFQVGQEVRAKIPLIDDLTDHGMGKQLCAEAGELLVVRYISPTGRTLHLSHPHVTDRAFIASPEEVEAVKSPMELHKLDTDTKSCSLIL